VEKEEAQPEAKDSRPESGLAISDEAYDSVGAAAAGGGGGR